MSVKRYRDVAEMPPPKAGDPNDPATYAAIKQLWQFASRLPRLFRPGVYRYRSIEEANADRERATIERMRRLRDSRG